VRRFLPILKHFDCEGNNFFSLIFAKIVVQFLGSTSDSSTKPDCSAAQSSIMSFAKIASGKRSFGNFPIFFGLKRNTNIRFFSLRRDRFASALPQAVVKPPTTLQNYTPQPPYPQSPAQFAKIPADFCRIFAYCHRGPEILINVMCYKF
jgi:hypothetical protein